MLEKQIERKLCDEVKNRNGMCLKQTGLAGIPDRLVLLPNGKCAFVELKAPGEKPRKLQQMRMKQLKKLGFKCFVIDGMEQIKPMLEVIADGV
ncbi:VRR-NUC domain-containing protein [Anaerovibrio lipolyticus]|uniref:VRR-NUC domain-containing protein n=1 Tax=Anaerovibrio lipolyticus TaxID=82374 RepID=UPI0026F1B590|nr:VRR-NUC domain-containing protein [Anaerovibrio lipolyticus]MBE6105282.1 VRR-NUC domain-containing protein [Anaerovibrio lipolyticus]